MARAKAPESFSQISQSLLEVHQRQFGTDVAPLQQSEPEWGISLADALPLQYALGVNALLLSRSLNIIGPPSGGKTQLSWELGRRIIAWPGFVNWFETENKASLGLLRSIVQLPDEQVKQSVFRFLVKDVDDFKAKATRTIERSVELIGDKLPIMILVDSLSDLVSPEMIKQLEGDESSGGFAEARLAADLTRWFKAMNMRFMGARPRLSLVFINHQKTDMAAVAGFRPGQGAPKQTTGSGGKHKDYQATWTIEVKEGSPDNKATGIHTPHYLTMIKNSMGPGHRKITYFVRHTINAETGERRTMFDWNDSLIRLLAEQPAAIRTDLLGLAGDGEKWTCKAVGIRDAQSRSDVGAAIHANAKLVEELQNMLCIERHRLFLPAQPEKKGKSEDGIN
jgi:RecA/RadA recombinase